MLRCIEALKNEKIYCRRYFYPSLSTLPFVTNQLMPVCDSVSKRIVCLPLYHTLTFSDLDLISRILLREHQYRQTKLVEQPATAVRIEAEKKTNLSERKVTVLE